MATNFAHSREWWDQWKPYTDGLEIPTDWEDTTWHNDELPSFRIGRFHIWLNTPDRKEREEHADWRFCVQQVDEHGEIIYFATENSDLLTTEDINEVIALTGANTNDNQQSK